MTTVAGADDEASLGSGDVFDVRVFGEKELSSTYQVGADGNISFPFLGLVQVVGRQPNEIALEIQGKLKEGGFLRDPQVSVFVQAVNSRRVSIIGAVSKPGTLPLGPGMTLVEAVSQAGGFAPLANKDDTVVTRREAGALKKYRIQVTEITKGNADDFALRAGDIVFVPERVF